MNVAKMTNLAKTRLMLNENSNEMFKGAPLKVAILTKMAEVAKIMRLPWVWRKFKDDVQGGNFDENGENSPRVCRKLQ